MCMDSIEAELLLDYVRLIYSSAKIRKIGNGECVIRIQGCFFIWDSDDFACFCQRREDEKHAQHLARHPELVAQEVG